MWPDWLRLVIGSRSRVPSPVQKISPAENLCPVGETGEFSSPWSIFCAVFYVDISSITTASEGRKDPGHSARQKG